MSSVKSQVCLPKTQVGIPVRLIKWHDKPAREHYIQIPIIMRFHVLIDKVEEGQRRMVNNNKILQMGLNNNNNKAFKKNVLIKYYSLCF